MKKFAAALCGTLLTLAPLVHAADSSKEQERLQAAEGVINEIMATPDKSIPQSILSGAYCVTVIPSYKKAAFVVGGQYGQGVTTCRTGHDGKWRR